jgi:hypothetical protein
LRFIRLAADLGAGGGLARFPFPFLFPLYTARFTAGRSGVLRMLPEIFKILPSKSELLATLNTSQTRVAIHKRTPQFES